jgi:hypothetical protein
MISGRVGKVPSASAKSVVACNVFLEKILEIVPE